jgi:hypothetical protein
MIQRHADGGNEACSAWLRRHRDRLLAKVPPHLLTMKPAEPPRRRAKRTPGEGGVNGNARRPS